MARCLPVGWRAHRHRHGVRDSPCFAGTCRFRGAIVEYPGIGRSLTAALARRVPTQLVAPIRPTLDRAPREHPRRRKRAASSPLRKLAGVFQRDSKRAFCGRKRRRVLAKDPVDSAATRALNARKASMLRLFVPTTSSRPGRKGHPAATGAGVGHAGAEPGPTRSTGSPPSCCARGASLVLLHPARAHLRTARGWPAPHRHAHAVALIACRFARLYRFVNGNRAGLIACCGGAYGAAHTGLTRR